MDKTLLIYFRGALTSKPYAFLARPWEFKSVDSIDIFDSLGSNIRVDLRGDKILRILPRSNDLINEDWISDKIRFVCDAIRLQRLDSAILKYKQIFYTLTWKQVFSFLTFFFSSFSFSISSSQFGVSFSKFLKTFFVAGAFVDLDSASILSHIRTGFFFKSESWSNIVNQTCRNFDRSSFLLREKLDNLVHFDNIVLVGCNIKLIAPVLAIRLRSLAKGGVNVYNFGRVSNQSFLIDLGSINDFYKVLLGNHWLVNRFSHQKTFFLFGEGFKLTDESVLSLFANLNFEFGFLSNFVANLNLNEYCVASSSFSEEEPDSSLIEVHTNCSTSTVSNLYQKEFQTTLKPVKVSIASHGGLVADSADLLIPVSAVFEQSKFYLNSLGFKQKTRLCLSSPGNALDHSNLLGLFYSSLFVSYLLTCSSGSRAVKLFTFFSSINLFYLADLKERGGVYINFFFKWVDSSLNLSSLVNFVFEDFGLLNKLLNSSFVIKNKSISLMPNKVKTGFIFESISPDFYRSDEISSVSLTLANASKRLINRSSFIS